MKTTIVMVALAGGVACAGDDGQTPLCGDLVCSGGESTASCAVDCPASPVCGDGTCSGGETTASCPADCGAGACTPDPASCAGETICVGGTCVPAFGRAYRIVAISATVPQRDPNGEAWDVPGGLPDPYAVISLNGTALGMTVTAQDTLNAAWNQGTAPTVIPAGSTVRVDVYDEDIADDDSIVGCVAAPITADHLHAGGMSCSGALGTVDVGLLR
jgi:hypothetical protein